MKVIETKTSSGTRVVIFSDPTAHLFTFAVNFNVGAVNEWPGKFGIAHFLEHMAFQGTSRMNAKQLAAAVEGMGGESNAFTGYEETQYYITCMPQYVHDCIQLLGHTLADSQFPEEELAKERQVILQERSDRNDDANQVLWNLALKDAYGKKNRLAEDIIGSVKEIKALTRDDLINFVQGQYIRKNATVFVYGNVGHKYFFSSILESIDRHIVFPDNTGNYSRIQHAIESVPATGKPARATGKFDSFYGKVMAVQHTEDRFDVKQNLAKQIMSELIGGGYTSVLYQKIRQDLGIVYSVGSFVWELNNNHIFASTLASGSEANLAKAIGIIHDTYANLTKLIRESGIETARKMVKTRLARQLSSFTGCYSVLSDLALRGQVVAPSQLMYLVDAVTEDDVVECAKAFEVQPMYTAMLLKK